MRTLRTRGMPMLHWWRQRKSERERIIRQTDELIALHGEGAYSIARDNRIRTLQEQQHREHRFWSAVAKQIAERTGREVVLDTATRYLAVFPRNRNNVGSSPVHIVDRKGAPAEPAPPRVMRELPVVPAEGNVVRFPALPSARRGQGRRRAGCGSLGKRPGLGSGSSR